MNCEDCLTNAARVRLGTAELCEECAARRSDARAPKASDLCAALERATDDEVLLLCARLSN